MEYILWYRQLGQLPARILLPEFWYIELGLERWSSGSNIVVQQQHISYMQKSRTTPASCCPLLLNQYIKLICPMTVGRGYIALLHTCHTLKRKSIIHNCEEPTLDNWPSDILFIIPLSRGKLVNWKDAVQLPVKDIVIQIRSTLHVSGCVSGLKGGTPGI